MKNELDTGLLILFLALLVIFGILFDIWLWVSDRETKNIFFKKNELIVRILVGLLIIFAGPKLESISKNFDNYFLEVLNFAYMCFLKAALTMFIWKSILDWMKNKGEMEKKIMTIQITETVSIEDRVKEYYWKYDLNCATTNLKILSEIFSITLSDQIISAAIGMHGAGKYGAQCGLVEGTLMFLGIIGKEYLFKEETIVDQCREYAKQFENMFQSLSCSTLRPEGFNKENSQHLCENLTCSAIEFNKKFVSQFINEKR